MLEANKDEKTFSFPFELRTGPIWQRSEDKRNTEDAACGPDRVPRGADGQHGHSLPHHNAPREEPDKWIVSLDGRVNRIKREPVHS